MLVTHLPEMDRNTDLSPSTTEETGVEREVEEGDGKLEMRDLRVPLSTPTKVYVNHSPKNLPLFSLFRKRILQTYLLNRGNGQRLRSHRTRSCNEMGDFTGILEWQGLE